MTGAGVRRHLRAAVGHKGNKRRLDHVFSNRVRRINGTFTFVVGLWDLTIVTLTFADVAQRVRVEWRVRLGFSGAVALARLATSTFCIGTGTANFVAANTYFLHLHGRLAG